LLEQLQPAVRAGIEVPLVTREGDPVNEILEQAKRMQADLIVLATHGRSGFDRLALGSVAEKVLRKADCPVLMVPVEPVVEVGRKGEPPPFEGYRKIVCAIDFSEHSLQALKFAVSVARHGGGAVTIVHVVEVADEPEVGVEADTPVAKVRRQRMETARYSLTQLAGEQASGGCSLETVVRLGKAHREILDVAARSDADLVVMGVRGRGAIDLTLFGSTTNQVVRLARCAVLTVRT
jgi:nucleotide-binding universal stress UspA family protein